MARVEYIERPFAIPITCIMRNVWFFHETASIGMGTHDDKKNSSLLIANGIKNK